MDKRFLLDTYDYDLPQKNIAQYPAAKRDQSRLLILNCLRKSITHKRFSDIRNYFSANDLLVVNNSKVFPARILGRKETGGRVEMFLLHYPVTEPAGKPSEIWHNAQALALIKSSKRPKIKSRLLFADDLHATIEDILVDGKVKITLHYQTTETKSFDDLLQHHGKMPLPPYIQRPDGVTTDDRDRYQTKYAEKTGSVAAPTAGLHFTNDLLENITKQGVLTTAITLHVGYGTFAPVRTNDIRKHKIHAEYIELSEDTATLINNTKNKGGRIWAVGTTTARTLEAATDEQGLAQPYKGLCDLFIYPGYVFKTVDNLITNFHLPRSSLLFLVSALAGQEQILSCYQTAIENGYRFYSYGDAMAIITRNHLNIDIDPADPL
jgi:S-adenosylmethionine:tRNA ribosyltransferase-isomerase